MQPDQRKKVILYAIFKFSVVNCDGVINVFIDQILYSFLNLYFACINGSL